MSGSFPVFPSSLMRRIFATSSMRRWNDQACPVEFVELDKQAHKAVIMYSLAKYLEDTHGSKIDYEVLIQHFIFGFFGRVFLTDIKPPVFHKMEERCGDDLVRYVMDKMEEEISGEAPRSPDSGETCEKRGIKRGSRFDFFKNKYPFLFPRDGGSNEGMEAYLRLDKNSLQDSLEDRILEASHLYSSKWEFDIIYRFNPRLYGVEDTKDELYRSVDESFSALGLGGDSLEGWVCEFIDMIGKLRFQRRWTTTPRVPDTSVLGHTLFVAVCSYMLSFDLGCCKQMRVNNFFGGLFHDLPEALTRDIISPVKHFTDRVNSVIRDMEGDLVTKSILPNVSEFMGSELLYLIKDEFKNKYFQEGSDSYEECIDAEEFLSSYNRDELNPVCGELLGFFDKLGAFLEARLSIEHGISSVDLEAGVRSIFNSHRYFEIGGLHLWFYFYEILVGDLSRL